MEKNTFLRAIKFHALQSVRYAIIKRSDSQNKGLHVYENTGHSFLYGNFFALDCRKGET